MKVSNPKNELPGHTPTASESAAKSAQLVKIDGDLLKSVEVQIEARLGELQMTIEQLTALKPGASIAFDRRLNEPIDLYLNGTIVARGEIVAVDDHFGVRIVEIGSLA